MNKEIEGARRTQAQADTSKLRRESAVWGIHSGVGRILSYAADLLDPDIPQGKAKACCPWHWGQDEKCETADQEQEVHP